MLSKHSYVYLFLIFYNPTLLFAEEEQDMSAFDKPLPLFVYYPGIKYTLPTIDITRKSDGAEAGFITGKLAFDLMFELGGIPLNNKNITLVFFWNTSTFNANEQESPVNESVSISKNTGTSISGYYSYLAATILKRSANKTFSNVLDTIGVGLGVGTGRFSGTAKFANNKEYTDSTPITDFKVDRFVSWSAIIFVEHNFAREWIARLSITRINYNSKDYNGEIQEIAIGLSKAFSF